MNQTSGFADSIAFEGFDCKNHTREECEKRIDHRHLLENALKAVLDIIHPLTDRPQTTEMLRAQDVWQVLRQRLYLDKGGDPDGWSVDARDPMPMTEEELPKIKAAPETDGWTVVDTDDPDTLPKNGDHILLSFANFNQSLIGRYEDGAFYLGDCDESDTCANANLFVNAWMPLPEAYRV